MPDYKALYFHLFNSVSDAIERLKQAQQEAEEMYISDDPSFNISIVNNEPNIRTQKKSATE